MTAEEVACVVKMIRSNRAFTYAVDAPCTGRDEQPEDDADPAIASVLIVFELFFVYSLCA